MNPELLDMLTEILEYMEDREDADLVGDPPDYRPNKEMNMAGRIREYINRHE